MSLGVPRLDLQKVRKVPSRQHSPEHNDSHSTRIPGLSPPPLESPFDPGHFAHHHQATLQPDKDYKVFYRLSADGKLMKVVRRHEFGPIDWEKLAKLHHKGIVKPKVHLMDASLDQPTDQKPTTSYQKSFPDKDPPIVKRVASSEQLLHARRILNTTLSLEYGKSHKRIKTNSSVSEFLEYYKHKYVRQVSQGEKKSGMKVIISDDPDPPPNQPPKPESISLKYVKTNARLGKLLGKIQASRPTLLPQSTVISSLPTCGKSGARFPASILKPSLPFSRTRPASPNRSLTFLEIEACVTEAKNSLKPLQQSRENLRRRMVNEMMQLSTQLSQSYQPSSREMMESLL